MAVAWIAVVVILVTTLMMLLLPTEWVPKTARERVQNRALRFRIYLSLVAVIVLGTVAVQIGIPVMDLIARRSEEFYKAALWPGVVLVALLVFGGTVIRILRDATVESITVGSSGVSMKFSKDEARVTLDELTRELTDTANGLDDSAKELFKTIYKSNGTKTVGDLCDHFVRDNKEHRRLRTLRNLNLIIPREGGKWLPETHPVVTGFGRIVYPHIDRLPSAKTTEEN